VSNLGTQASLYGIGLWLFQQRLQVVDFAAVAVVVTLARLAILPVLGKRLATWPRRRTMFVANGIGGCVSGALALLLLLGEGRQPLALLLALMAISAAAEAALVITFSSLITTLVPEAGAQRRAAGLFASSDGIVLTVAPFLGAALASHAGLQGLLVVDGLSFVWACLSVLCAPWPHSALLPMNRLRSLAPVAVGFFSQMAGLLRHASLGPLARQGMAIAFVYAGCEVLFPAWLVAGMGAERLSSTLVVSGMGYGLGVLLWSWRRPSRPLDWLLWGALIQSALLIGNALVVFEHLPPIWWLGILLFSLSTPIIMAALQVLWLEQVASRDQPSCFALRFSLEWWSRIVGFVGLSALADVFVGPMLRWQALPGWLASGVGSGPGRPMALTLAIGGWVLLLTTISQASALHNFNSQAQP